MKKGEKIDAPGPTSYNSQSAFNFTNVPRGQLARFGKNKRVSFVEQSAKKSISPGPAKHSGGIGVLNKITLSPSMSRKRI